ncbi:MAG: flagellar biosynthesis anti-sigma factor FlgM [Terracidiphilus sp.]
MRIDQNQGAQPLPETSRSVPSNVTNGGTGAAASGNALGEDQAQLSGTHVQIQALTAQALQFPEIRQEKVNALRQVVRDGTYQPSPRQVADAVFAHIVATSAA